MMINPIIVKSNSIPPSLNQMYLTRGNHRILTPEARQWKEQTAIQFAEQLNAINVSQLIDKRLSVRLIVYSSNWLTKTKNIRKVDVSNYEKASIDTLFQALRIYDSDLDDSQIFSISIQKVDSDKNYIQIEITGI